MYKMPSANRKVSFSVFQRTGFQCLVSITSTAAGATLCTPFSAPLPLQPSLCSPLPDPSVCPPLSAPLPLHPSPCSPLPAPSLCTLCLHPSLCTLSLLTSPCLLSLHPCACPLSHFASFSSLCCPHTSALITIT